MTTVRRTGRWRAVVALALVAAAVALLAKQPRVLLVAGVAVAYASYPHLTTPPDPSLSLDRSVDPASPAPDEPVSVRVTLRNDGDRTLPDVSVVDGVPALARVVSGTPRHATALRPGESATWTYEVAVDPGLHRFRPATVLARDASGGTEVETTVDAPTELDCPTARETRPPLDPTLPFPGAVESETSGTGTAFARLGEYHPGDPLGRIDWRRFARTGDLATVEFRERHQAAVLVCADARPAACRGPPDRIHGAARCLSGAGRLVAALADRDVPVGFASLGPSLCWHRPSRSPAAVAATRCAIAAHPALDAGYPTDEQRDEAADGDEDGEQAAAPREFERQREQLRARLDGRQLVLLSPLCDDFPVETAATLSAVAPVTVIAPDPIDSDGAGAGGRLAAVERTNRIARLRGAGVDVIEWERDEALPAALARSREGLAR